MKFLTIAAFFTVLACAYATYGYYRPSSYYGYNPIAAPISYAPYVAPYAAPYVKSYAAPYAYSAYNPIGYGGYYGYGDYGYYKK